MQNSKNGTNGQLQLNDAPKTQADAGKQDVDLAAPGVAKALARRVLADIDEYCVRTYDGGHRSHLGASLIGDPCQRKLWLQFRWTYREPTDGRKQRLFNRGHREEARFIEWLKGIGATVYEHSQALWFSPQLDDYILKGWFDDTSGGTGSYEIVNDSPWHVEQAAKRGIELKQFRISGVMGHFGGSLDGIAFLPERYGIKEPVLLEFKTNGTGAGFNKVCDEGMAAAKQLHFAQTSTYGSYPEYNFRFVLYFNINKNDDSLHVEAVKLDHNLGRQMQEKAERIILSQEPPPRLSDNPTYKDCTWCGGKDVCHKGAIPEKNCRSCKHAKPVENAEWWCDVHSARENAPIPKEVIPSGCGSYHPITACAKNG
jgi:hypothetical protein